MYHKNYATINLTKSGVVTNSQVGDIFPISSAGMKCIRIDIVGTFHAVGTITFKLQTSPDNVNWIDSKPATAITGADATLSKIALIDTYAGTASDTLLKGDLVYLPLAHICRLVVTSTDAGDTVAVTGIYVQQ